MTSAQARLPDGHVIADRFVVARRVGVGDMGEVYDVRDQGTGYAYALKLFLPELLRSGAGWNALRQEAERANALGHPGIVRAYDFGAEPHVGSPYVLGEYVLLPTLDAIVRTEGPISVVALAHLMAAVRDTLDAAHRAGLLHRGLKPQNIFVQRSTPHSWEARIGDFGVAAARLHAPAPPGWPATPGWLPAEQADPSIPPTPSVDTYTLGLIAFFALTARSPFVACQYPQLDLNLLWAEMTAPLPPASQRARELGASISPALDPWFARALAVSPPQRYASVREMTDHLGSMAGQEASRDQGLHAAVGAVATAPAVVIAPMAPSPVGSPAQGAAVPQPLESKGLNPDSLFSALGPGSPQGDAVVAPMAPPAAAPAPDEVEATDSIPSDVPRPTIGPMKVVAIVAGAGVAAVLIVIGIWIVLVSRSDTPAPKPRSAAASASVPPATPPSAPGTTASVAPPASSLAPVAAVDAAPPPSDSLVSFTCEPSCDKLEIACDDVAVRDPGAGVRLGEGKHTCVAAMTGYRKVSDTFETKAGENVTRSLRLTKIPTVAPTPAPQRTCGTFLNPCK